VVGVELTMSYLVKAERGAGFGREVSTIELLRETRQARGILGGSRYNGALIKSRMIMIQAPQPRSP
jgi:hypothetical protein